MVEAITESFCERCGTRYQFKAPTRLTPLRRTRGLVSGLRNYIMSQDALGDAIGDAMRSEEDALATAQLDAFHESFNFCINCRQYTCLNCWNDGAGRCRTCAPIAGTDDLLTQMQAAYAGNGGGAAAVPQLEYDAALDEIEIQRRLGMEAWPTSDLPATNGDMPPEWPEIAAAVAEAEPSVAEAASEPLPEPELQAEPAPEPVPEAPTRPPLRVVAWEEDVPTALEPELEPELEAPAVAAEAEPVVELPVEPEAEVAAAEALPEPPAAEPPPPPAAEPRPIRPIAPIAETILRLPPQPIAPVQPAPPQPVAPVQPPPQLEQPPMADPIAAQLAAEELAARRAQLDLLGLGDPGQGPVTPEPGTVLPYRSRGAAAHPSDAARAAAAAQGQSFWEASAREVAGAASQIGLHSCDGCGLSLSANARFCRRCGTRQARSA